MAASAPFAFNFFAQPSAAGSAPPPPAPPPAGGAVVSFCMPADAAARAAAQGGVPCGDGCGGLQRLLPAAAAADGAASAAAAPLVVADAYEGGASVWECTADVLRWLESAPAARRVRVRGCAVLDLGCGAALLGAWAARRGAAAVVCQDLNAAVLRDVAAPTLALNGAAAAGCALTLLAGAWAAMAAALDGGAAGAGDDWRAVIGGGACAAVVASEVLYRQANYAALTRVLAHCLAPDGVAVIGTKRLYFGATLGGGSAAFVDHVRGSGSGLAARVVHSIEDGRSMTRDIVVVEWAGSGAR